MYLPNRILRRTFYYAKRKHVVNGLFEWLARNCNVIVVEVGRDVQTSLHLMAHALREGGNLLIFPEGTRSPDGKIGDFKPTFAALAIESGVPVVPVAISGAIRALPRGRHFPRLFTKVNVRFLPPVQESERTDESRLADFTREAIARNLRD